MSSNNRELNPYAAPKDTGKSSKRVKKKKTNSDDNPGAIDEIVRSFEKTRSWISFFGVLTYLGVALLILGSVALLAMPSKPTPGNPLSNFGPAIALVYLVIGVIYVFVGRRLFRYRDAITGVMQSNGDLDDIAYAVRQQFEFWQLVGRITVSMLVLYGFIIIIAIMAAGAASSR